MKIAMLNCLDANRVCAAAGCLRAFNTRSRHFAEYGDTPLELTAMARCNGCGQGIDEGFREKLDREIVKLGRMSPGSPEAAVIYNYVDTCLNIPRDRRSAFSARDFTVRPASSAVTVWTPRMRRLSRMPACGAVEAT